jgi:hypothetical protein
MSNIYSQIKEELKKYDEYIQESIQIYKHFLNYQTELASKDNINRLTRQSEYSEKRTESSQFSKNIYSDNDLPAADDSVIRLDASLKTQFERAFGTDLSDVRIHRGQYSNELVHSNGADAVTIGTDIYFANGRYAPDTEEGIRLLTHELQHVIQFKRGDRMKYHEDISELENEAGKTEEKLDDNRLHNLSNPAFADSQTLNIHTGQSPSEQYQNLYRKNNFGTGLKDSFNSNNEKQLYYLTLSNGNKAYFDNDGIIEILDETRQKINETIMLKKSILTTEEYENFMLNLYSKLNKNY